MSTGYATLEDVIADDSFPDVDMSLRRGRHVDRDDADWYTFLIDAQPMLETFYARFGCELIHKSDGYFYLLPTNDKLGKRHLSSAEMLVGQALTLLYLDPATVEQGGTVTREQVMAQLAGVLGADSLVMAMNPKRRRPDARIAEETARTRVGEALRRLGSLGFVDAQDEARIRLRPPLLRFAEPVRGGAEPEAALKRLVDKGEFAVSDPGGTPVVEDDESVVEDGESVVDDESTSRSHDDEAEEIG